MTVNPYQAPAANLSPSATQAAVAAPALWNPDAAGNWSLLFTPIFGAILVSKNWQAIGEPKRAASARIWAYVSVPIVALGLGFPLLIIWYFASNRPQSRFVKSQWGANYPRKPWGKPLAIAFVLGVLALAAFFALGFLAPATPT